MLQNLFSPYGEIDEMNLEENAVKMMGLYKLAEPFSCLIDQLEKGRKFARAVGQIFFDAMMVPKVITILEKLLH